MTIYARGEPKAAEAPAGLVGRMRKALEDKDFEAQADLYADDAVLEEYSVLHPPAHPTVVRGRGAILERLRADGSRDPLSGWERRLVNASIIDEVETEDRAAFTVLREFFAGDRVISQHLAHVEHGRIVHDRIVAMWDPSG